VQKAKIISQYDVLEGGPPVSDFFLRTKNAFYHRLFLLNYFENGLGVQQLGYDAHEPVYARSVLKTSAQ
jgi:hypothetical protein